MSKKLRVEKINLPVFFIEEDDMVSAFTPALDIATCGKNEEEAKERFHELVTTFLDELCEMGTLEEVLLECGWKKISKPTVTWQPPIIKEYSEQISIPCPV